MCSYVLRRLWSWLWLRQTGGDALRASPPCNVKTAKRQNGSATRVSFIGRGKICPLLFCRKSCVPHRAQSAKGYSGQKKCCWDGGSDYVDSPEVILVHRHQSTLRSSVADGHSAHSARSAAQQKWTIRSRRARCRRARIPEATTSRLRRIASWSRTVCRSP
jgi:hypothetical protein